MKRRLAPLEKKFEENEELLVVAESEVKEAVNISSQSKTVSTWPALFIVKEIMKGYHLINIP